MTNITEILQWKIDSEGFFKRGSIKLYRDNVHIGTITDTSFKKSSEINGKRFLIKQDNSLLNYPKRHQLIDAGTGKIACEIQNHYSDNKVLAVFPDNTTHDITVGTDNPAQTNGQIIQSYPDKLWFAETGKLEIRTKKNIEALIACFYFVRYLEASSM